VRYIWLVLALLVAVMGVLVGRLLGLSLETTSILAAIPMFLMLFPFLKPWMPKLKFAHWALSIAIGGAVSWLLYLAFSGLLHLVR